jgi:hypothetical protein
MNKDDFIILVYSISCNYDLVSDLLNKNKIPAIVLANEAHAKVFIPLPQKRTKYICDSVLGLKLEEIFGKGKVFCFKQEYYVTLSKEMDLSYLDQKISNTDYRERLREAINAPSAYN